MFDDVVLFGDVLVTGQRSVPECVKLIAQRGHARWVEPIDPARARYAVGDQPRFLEHLQVLRYRRPADWQLVGKLAHRPWPLGQALDDDAPGAVPQGIPRISKSVSLHER